MNNPDANRLSPLFEMEFPVLFHDLDFNGTLGPVTLLNFMQTAASMHSLALGVSASDLRPLGLTWVISRIHLIIGRYPRGGEIVRLRTWPALRKGLFTSREFELNDGSGATSRARHHFVGADQHRHPTASQTGWQPATIPAAGAQGGGR